MVRKVKAKKDRKTAKELMAMVVNEELLKAKKEESGNKTTQQKTEKPVEEEIKKEKKWYEKPILEKDFIYKQVDGEFYAQHKEWNKHVWIGGYPNEYEAKQIVKDYCKECKKDILNRNIQNIHSVIFGEE